jgi:hypothetical protein
MGLVGSYQIDYARLLSARPGAVTAGPRMVLEQLGIADVASGGNFRGRDSRTTSDSQAGRMAAPAGRPLMIY